MRLRTSRRLIAATLGLIALTGCKDGWDELFKPKPADEPPPRPAGPVDPLVVDTIGQYAVVADTGGLRVRGFSLVIGLGENGSRLDPRISGGSAQSTGAGRRAEA